MKNKIIKKPLIGITADSFDPEVQKNAAWYSTEFWYALRYRYVKSIEDFGGVPFALPYSFDSIETYVNQLDGLLITGGGFDIDPKLYGDEKNHASVFLKTKRTEFEYSLCEAFLKQKKPILGICGGMQLLNVVCGGTLHQHVPDLKQDFPELENHQPQEGAMHYAHDVTIIEDTILHKNLGKAGSIAVNSVHHQAVKTLGPQLIANAIASDGLIEGFEHSLHDFVIGIQWHPEFLVQELDHSIFKSFIKAAAR